LALVEGLTEKTFVRDVLNPHFHEKGLHLEPVEVMTSRHRSGKKRVGGLSRYPSFRRDLRRLLGDSGVVVVTTMVDYYGLPSDFPGQGADEANSAIEQVLHLEGSLAAEINDPRFLPYLSLHEFEALVLAALDLPDLPEPETVDGEPETHPAKRLEILRPGYKKIVDGVLLTQQAGLEHLRSRCPHFDEWISQLEEIARTA
jgi:hypothetical protein